MPPLWTSICNPINLLIFAKISICNPINLLIFAIISGGGSPRPPLSIQLSQVNIHTTHNFAPKNMHFTLTLLYIYITLFNTGVDLTLFFFFFFFFFAFHFENLCPSTFRHRATPLMINVSWFLISKNILISRIQLFDIKHFLISGNNYFNTSKILKWCIIIWYTVMIRSSGLQYLRNLGNPDKKCGNRFPFLDWWAIQLSGKLVNPEISTGKKTWPN